MTLTHAILAALLERSCSGYDLAKRFDGSVGFFWHASHQQIYRELTKLEEQGYLEAETVAQEGRPDKKLFSVTEHGKDILRSWIATPSKVAPPKEELLVKLFAGYLVPREVILTELEQYRAQHSRLLDQYRSIEQQYFQTPRSLSPPAKFRYLTLRSGIRFETEWLAWCEEAIELLQDEE